MDGLTESIRAIWYYVESFQQHDNNKEETWNDMEFSTKQKNSKYQWKHPKRKWSAVMRSIFLFIIERCIHFPHANLLNKMQMKSEIRLLFTDASFVTFQIIV